MNVFRRVGIVVCVLFAARISAAFAQVQRSDAEWVPLGKDGKQPETVAYDLDVSQRETSITLTFQPHGFSKQTVSIGNEVYTRIELPGAEMHGQAGLPELPVLTVNLLVPPDTPAGVPHKDSVTLEWVDAGVVLPSREPIRDPDDFANRPYVRGRFYESGSVFPAQVVELGRPFTFRELRGVAVQISPFQYDRRSGLLGVVRELTVQIDIGGAEQWRVDAGAGDRDLVDPEFVPGYRSTFSNFDGLAEELNWQTASQEVAPLLIIAPDAWVDALAAFVNWKRQKGIEVFLETIEDVGNTEAQIRQTVDDYYCTEKIGHVMLVGDDDRVVSHRGLTSDARQNEADPVYGLLRGDDHYPEAFVSRVSADCASRVSAYLERCVEYERDHTSDTDWYLRSLWTASHLSDGICQDTLPLRNTLHDRLGHSVNAICTTGDTARDSVISAVNDGVSLVFYTGHGHELGWSTTGFQNEHVRELLNEARLPVVIVAACRNGDFAEVKCFAEEWLDAPAAEPRGAVAVYASSIKTVRSAAQRGQKQIVENLADNPGSTIGSLCFGSLAQCTGYAYGKETYETWHLFGDSTLQLRTATPTAIDASALPASLPPGTAPVVFHTDPGVNIGIVKENGTDYQLIGSGSSGACGNACIALTEELAAGDELLITLSGRNRIPVQHEVSVE